MYVWLFTEHYKSVINETEIFKNFEEGLERLLVAIENYDQTTLEVVTTPGDNSRSVDIIRVYNNAQRNYEDHKIVASLELHELVGDIRAPRISRLSSHLKSYILPEVYKDE